jgi:metal-dependent amidase/aminoacylase/carboxypeptidase family protein
MPDVRNHPELVHTTLPALRQAIGAPNVLQLQAAFPFNCEDFAYYTKLIPGAMYWLGAANPQKEQFAMLHTPNFDVDETCLSTGVMAMSALLIAALQQDFSNKN